MVSEIHPLSQALHRSCSILLKNDKLSPDGIFDEISKILFMKNQYDRECRGSGNGFSPGEFTRYLNRFELEIKREMKEERFYKEIHRFGIKPDSLGQIVEATGKFNLAELPGDVKGKAYEEFMVMTLRKIMLHFFTPRPLVDFMVRILDPCPGELICDPCCGRGSFLVRTFLYLKEKILQPPSETYKQYIEKNDLVNMSNDCIFGADANPRLAWASKLNLMMHDAGHEGIHLGDGLLNKRGIFDDRFDVVFANPPFGGQVKNSLEILPGDCMTEAEIADYELRLGTPAAQSLRLVKSKVGRPILEQFDLGKISKLTEVLFMERCLRLLKPGGRMGIILPGGVLNSDKLKKAREYMEGKAKILLVVDLPNDVFRHLKVVIEAGILFFKKFDADEENYYQRIKEAATKAVNQKYETVVKNPVASVRCGKYDKQELKKLEIKKESEIKDLVKEKFDYEIPMVCFEKTGKAGKIVLDEAQMDKIVAEYTTYRKENKLWEPQDNCIS